MTTPRILAFGGSLRRESFNHRVVQVAADAAEAAGAEVTRIRLSDFPLPLFDEDYEADNPLPESAAKLKELFREHHGFLIGCPEYNSAITAVLKNAIDWVSRPEEGRAPLDCFSGTYVGLVAASPGGLGGIRVLPSIRTLFSNIQCTVIPQQAAVAKVHEKLGDDGGITDEGTRTMVETVGRSLATTLVALHR